MADLIGRKLLDVTRSNAADHPSRRLHLKLAWHLPHDLLRRAVTDAVERYRDGRVGICAKVRDPGAYFFGVVRKMTQSENRGLTTKNTGCKLLS